MEEQKTTRRREENDFVRAENYSLEGWKPSIAKPLPSLRCYVIKKNGEQCKNFAILGTGIGDSKSGPTCKKHAPAPIVREKAEKRVQQARLQLLGMTKDAAKVVEEIMLYGTQENVRLAAANSILDRAGLKSAVEVNVTVEHNMSPMDAINEKLKIIASHNPQSESEDTEIIDEGEIIEEESDKTHE